MGIIRMNGLAYYQHDGGAHVISIAELLRELDGIVNEFNTRAPTHHNTRDAMTTCPHCNTALRLSETKHGHCAYCWRLI